MLRVTTLASFILLAVFQVADARSREPVISFGGECEGRSVAVSAELQSLIERSMQNGTSPCGSGQCRGVFALDLNSDRRKELFVRLGCGGTGNCTWGVFSDSPARLRGVVTAWFIYVRPRTGSWKELITYTREGGDRGLIVRLVNKRGKYRRASEYSEQGSYGNSQPFLKRMGIPRCS